MLEMRVVQKLKLVRGELKEMGSIKADDKLGVAAEEAAAGKG